MLKDADIPLLPSDLNIRLAGPDDAESIARLVRELAVYEHLAHEVVSTADDFRQALSRTGSTVEVLLAELDGRAVGFALFFRTFLLLSGAPGSISKTSSSSRNIAAAGSVWPFFRNFLRLPPPQLWPDGVGGSRLEPAGNRFLHQEISGPAFGRMEDLPD